MIQQTDGLIVINEKRKHFQTDFYRRYTSFPTNENADVIKEIFPNLLELNDETLAPDASADFRLDNDAVVVVLPLAGAIMLNEIPVVPGEIFFFSGKDKDVVTIKNPFETAFVNYIIMQFQTQIHNAENCLHSFELDINQNKLQSIHNQLINNKIAIGKFDKRIEGAIDLIDKNERCIAINLSGSFEFQDRLLNERDAVLLWNCPNAEFESLAPESILLVISG